MSFEKSPTSHLIKTYETILHALGPGPGTISVCRIFNAKMIILEIDS